MNGLVSLKSPVFEERPPELLYLYNEGDECVDVTGGWQFVELQNNHTEAKNANSIYCKAWAMASRYNRSNVATVNAIDLSGYSKLKVWCTLSIKAQTGGQSVQVLAGDTVLYDNKSGGDVDASVTPLEFDISEINTSQIIKLVAHQGGGLTSTSVYSEFYMYKCALEE